MPFNSCFSKTMSNAVMKEVTTEGSYDRVEGDARSTKLSSSWE